MRLRFTNHQTKKTKLRQAGVFIIALLVANLFLINVSAQTYTKNLYSQDFGTGTSFPSGWSASGMNPWTISTSTSSTTPTFSGGSNAFCGTGSSITLTFNGSLSTVGYTNITVLWAGWRNSTRALTFEWSSNGSTWNSVSYNDVSNNSTWAYVSGTGGAGTRISLPAGAAGVSNLRFRWTISNSSGYRIDDFTVEGTAPCPTITASATKNDVSCFNTSTGIITITGSGGTSPYSFSIDNGSNFNATTIAGASYVPINSTSGKFINLPVNSYKIMVQDVNGCKSKSVQ